MGLFDRLKSRLTKTRAALSDGITSLFKGGRAIDAQLLGELEELLYTADLGALAVDLVADVERAHKRGDVKGEEDVRARLKQSLLERLQPEPLPLELPHQPTVVLVAGVNGSGKTTSIAKLAHHFTSQGKKVLLGAGDTFRAAAADQLEVWAGRTGAAIVRGPEGGDPASVAFDAVDKGVKEGFDLVLIDTAGRLHTQSNLMSELEKVRRVIGKRLEGAPHRSLLVLDGTNGQNAVAQAKLFTEAIQIDGLIVTKLDGTARGGAVFTIHGELGLPVHYLGTGEQMDLLEPFDPSAFADAILAFGPAE
ncbi:MAG: signal recognition particle-docking protein FtsY [Planctomycetota bacterium]|jgi:fused signal recognition particle receptor